MQITIGRCLSLVIGMGYAVGIVLWAVGHCNSTAEIVVRSYQDCLGVCVPVALIWFPEQIGAMTGYLGRGVVDMESPPILVTIMGWVFLVGIPVFRLLMLWYLG